ncbi:alpha-N-acetylgalactosaminidase-like [Mizuhopecten yessoensis]|uniref:alpha-N-acetylgalactosaminidase-like n=1 Tax=Mizuhopecten yessoensis TaxID=6573 RepID=UPI000B4590F8|nr:alpha-N-acetylgalactosaminidase-like [Mizuhopecten yessoensis]XP_021367072.1 alpha-N-acetylgalactosaminidase-like [Mizuhopecten yessoensis]XP_021367073.1 alpha-N-acetylgalactosaminidase-like [Mizuhopecten yessoensis]
MQGSVMILPLVILVIIGTIWGLDNGLARTPPMGWMSWERFRCITDCDTYPKQSISEQLYKDMADQMVLEGFAAAGYEYVNIDDCWSAKERDENGRLQADPKRFPSGIKALADYVHNKSLKLGIYGDFGTFTCGGYPGSKFYMQEDAETFASWGIDSLKLDGCYTSRGDIPVGYPIMEKFLNLTGRPILYSCSWPAYLPNPDYEAIAKSCNIWRNYGDIQDSWSSVVSIINFYGKDSGNFSSVAGPGQFNDPDMLILGDFGLSYNQQQVQMAMWSILAAPLLMSNDLRKIKRDSIALLQNRGAISINQDPLGVQGRLISTKGKIQFWSKPITPKGNYAFAVLNLADGGSETLVPVNGVALGILDNRGYNISDAFTNKYMGAIYPNKNLPLTVLPSGVFLGKAFLLPKEQ